MPSVENLFLNSLNKKIKINSETQEIMESIYNFSFSLPTNLTSDRSKFKSMQSFMYAMTF